MKSGLARLIMSKEETPLLALSLERSITIPEEMIRLVRIVWENVVHLYRWITGSTWVVGRVILWRETARWGSMGFMKWEPMCGNGFKEKVHKLAPEVAPGGMELDRCTGNTRHTKQKFFMRFILALGVPLISKLSGFFDHLDSF